MKNLVLGGSGAIGEPLCEFLTAQGEEVVNLDIKAGFDLRSDDLELYKDFDYVWFLAWDVGGSKYLTDQGKLLDIMKNNATICERVFKFLEKHEIPFMFASTQLAAPDNTYGITKLLGEEWARLLGGSIVKFWNIYGWETPGIRSHVIPDLVMQAIKEGEINLMTTGVEHRQFVYVKDCVKNLHAIRENGGKSIDLTNGDWVTIFDVAQVIGEKLGVEVKRGEIVGYENMIEPATLPDYIGFSHSLSDGIDEIIDHAKSFIKAN